ncbi:MAG: hypothetical protein M3Y80_11675 [Verrucomicrobiota bacterium]|nr:hypothetical protein [Verrucomicrobiota bacterium]
MQRPRRDDEGSAKAGGGEDARERADADQRWLEFGLEMPATKTAPGQPTNLPAQMDATGAVRVSCDAEPLAHRYRFRTLIVGAETKYRLAASAVDPTALIKGTVAGDTVRIIVQAVNGTSQGVASEPIEFTVLMVEKATAAETVAPAAAPLVIEPLVVPTNGNGNGNGHGRDGHANGANGHGRRNRMATV